MEVNRRFVIGDIHGAYRALLQCFERSKFDPVHDLLISLGDVCDSWPDVSKVIDALLKIDHFVLLLGNHDAWALDWFLYKDSPEIWTMQGGNATIQSYPGEVPLEHIQFLTSAKNYYLLGQKLFVHGGMKRGVSLEDQDRQIFSWDRSLVKEALNLLDTGKEINLTGYEEVYVGHTPTIRQGSLKPIRACEVYMMDTGAGWPGGVLTMMDIDTKEIFSSDEVSALYQGIKGRV